MTAPFKVVAGGHADQFTFQLEGTDDLWAIPYVGDLDTATVYDMATVAKQGEGDLLLWTIDKFREWCPGLVDTMSIEQFGYLVGAWRSAGREAQGVDVGESSASSS